jgi:hypothetical protein
LVTSRALFKQLPVAFTYANVHTTAHPGGEIRGGFVQRTMKTTGFRAPAKLILLPGCQPRSGEAFYFWYSLA